MKFILLGLLLAGALGCATNRSRPQPLTESDIITLTHAGVGDDEIMHRIDNTRSIFRLGADDVVQLRQAGVSVRVVDYMLDTYARYVTAEQRRAAIEDEEWQQRYNLWPVRPRAGW